MQARANAIQMSAAPMTDARDERQTNQSGANPSHSTTPRTGQDRIPPYDRGTIIVAGAWLAFYLIMAIHHFIPAAIEIAAQRG
jgi:hypothetical protein